MFKGKLGKKNNKSYEDIHYSCTIRFLDDSDPLNVTFQKETRGQWLVDHVCKELNLMEKDYFGLRFVDSEKQRHWLDPWKPVYKQLKNVNPVLVFFRVKFYPPDPSKLKEEITRYFLFLQLRRDLHHGRLLCSPTDANLLAAYIVQSEVGDYDPQDHTPGYVSKFKMLPKQTQKQEEKIAEIHKTFTGQVPAEAETSFLKKACTLDTYGVDPHPVKDQRNNQMYLGVTHLGIVTFQGNKRTHLFKWPQITKIAFEGKMFICHVTISETEENSLLTKGKKHACGFKCPTYSACKHLWKCAVEQQYFFTLASSSEVPKVTSGGGFFTRGSKFRFSGRCQKEVYSESATINRDEPAFTRSCSNPQLLSSLNKLRSVSLPNKLKDKAQNMDDDDDADANNISALDATNITDRIDETIPEETPVKLADVPYEPMQSPSSEDLPPFPTGEDATPVDLDAQISQLQKELDQCKGSEGNDVREMGIDTIDSPIVTGAAAITQNQPPPPPSSSSHEHSPEGSTNTHHPHPVLDSDSPTDGPPTMELPQRGVSCCRVLTFSFFVVFTVMLIMVFFVLESEMDVPVIKDLRQMPEVQDFKQQTYNPFKTTVAQKMGGWF